VSLPPSDTLTLRLALELLSHVLQLQRRPRWATEILGGARPNPEAMTAKLPQLNLGPTSEELSRATRQSRRWQDYAAERLRGSQVKATYARELSAQGDDLQTIALALGVSTRQVRRYLKGE